MENDYQFDYEGFDPSEPESYIALSMYQSTYLSHSLLIASKIQHQFKIVLIVKIGVKQAGFLVLSRATMPSVLIELGFLTNNKEEDFLNSEQGKIYMASAIFRAIKEYKIEMESVILDNHKKVSDNSEKQLFFSVQFLSSKSQVNLEDLQIDQLSLVSEFYDNKTYKYSYGKVETLKEVSLLKKKLINYGFQDCFTIAILMEKMSLSNALSILK